MESMSDPIKYNSCERLSLVSQMLLRTMALSLVGLHVHVALSNLLEPSLNWYCTTAPFQFMMVGHVLVLTYENEVKSANSKVGQMSLLCYQVHPQRSACLIIVLYTKYFVQPCNSRLPYSRKIWRELNLAKSPKTAKINYWRNLNLAIVYGEGYDVISN